MKNTTRKVEGKERSSQEDARFSHIANDPIFRRVPAKEKRVNVDERFHSMFHDSKFDLNYTVDKRGKPLSTKKDTRLKTYYNAEDSDEAAFKDSNDEGDSHHEETDEEQNDIDFDTQKSTLSEDVRKKLHNVDYARGEYTFASEEESSDDSTDTEEDDENLMHEWGEIDKDAPRIEEASCRLALCNMDWDKLRAADLMILFSSFTPAQGILKSVTIYPSEFGKQRIAEEDINGPQELADVRINESDDDSDENDTNNGEDFHMEKLRKYQLNRLKYYYAVLEFDSTETAEKVYSECDGMEYESSATRVDLRFIPDEMTFDDEESKDRCDTLPEADKYRPRFFTTTALQQIKVNLTWDETDPNRRELTEMLFDPKSSVNEEDLQAYLASSSSDSESEVEEAAAEELEKISQSDRLAKYRNLLESIEENERKEKDKDVEMEITWGVGLKKKTEELVKQKNEEKTAKDRTPWEERLAKQKEKKKQKRILKKKIVDSESDNSDDCEKPFSDDEVDIDLNDDFFKDELKNINLRTKKNKKKVDSEQTNQEATEADKAALELLMMDDDDNKSHFSLKKIMATADDKTKKKKKRKGKKFEEPPKKMTDNFQINVSDERFSALFVSHHYNVDPSDPNYKKTEAMEKIIAEKIKRRPTMEAKKFSSEKEKQISFSEPNLTQEEDKRTNDKFELQSLVKSIKRKAEDLKLAKTQKRLK